VREREKKSEKPWKIFWPPASRCTSSHRCLITCPVTQNEICFRQTEHRDEADDRLLVGGDSRLCDHLEIGHEMSFKFM